MDSATLVYIIELSKDLNQGCQAYGPRAKTGPLCG